MTPIDLIINKGFINHDKIYEQLRILKYCKEEKFLPRDKSNDWTKEKADHEYREFMENQKILEQKFIIDGINLEMSNLLMKILINKI